MGSSKFRAFKRKKEKMRTTIVASLALMAATIVLSLSLAQVQSTNVNVTWELSSNVTSDATGAIVIIDGTPYTQAQLSHGLTLTRPAGSSNHTLMAVSIVTADLTKRYAFLAWTNALPGLSASSPNGTFTWPSNSSIIIANYTTQYEQTLYYSVIDGGTPPAPTFTASQLGVSFSQTVSSSPTGYYFDSGSNWTVTNPLERSGNSERWQSNQTLNGTISGASTLNITYYHQFLVNFTYELIGGGSPSAPTVRITQFGLPTSAIVSRSPVTQRWVDSGSFYSYSGLLGGSNDNERWDSNSGSGSITAAVSLNPAFYHQYQQTLSYKVIGGGTPSAPSFTAYQFGTSFTQSLTTSLNTQWFDANVSWTVEPNPLAGSKSTERWYSNQVLNGSIGGPQTLAFTYYHQFQENLSYGVMGDSSGSSPPSFTANQFGVSTPKMLSTFAGVYWFDNGTSWVVTNPLVGSTASERWFSSQLANGEILGARTLVFIYAQQYYLTIQVNPSYAGNATPLSGFFDYGSEVEIAATGTPGYAFKNWTGSGKGSFTGTESSALVTMSAAITERAFFNSQPMVNITVTCNEAGQGFVIVDGKPIVCPQTFSWIPGSSHTIEALNPSKGLTQYTWQSWNDGGAQSHTITAPSYATTFMVTFATTSPLIDLIRQFLVEIIAAVVAGVILYLLVERRKKTSERTSVVTIEEAPRGGLVVHNIYAGRDSVGKLTMTIAEEIPEELIIGVTRVHGKPRRERLKDINGLIQKVLQSVLEDVPLALVVADALTIARTLRKDEESRWLERELYGYEASPTDQPNTFPEYRRISTKIPIRLHAFTTEGEKSEDFAVERTLFVSFPIVRIEDTAKRARIRNADELVFWIQTPRELSDLAREQGARATSDSPGRIPCLVQISDLERIVSELRLRIHKFVSARVPRESS
jgi:hypothetical protein